MTLQTEYFYTAAVAVIKPAVHTPFAGSRPICRLVLVRYNTASKPENKHTAIRNQTKPPIVHNDIILAVTPVTVNNKQHDYSYLHYASAPTGHRHYATMTIEMMSN